MDFMLAKMHQRELSNNGKITVDLSADKGKRRKLLIEVSRKH
jgi:hypothetical protein